MRILTAALIGLAFCLPTGANAKTPCKIGASNCEYQVAHKIGKKHKHYRKSSRSKKSYSGSSSGYQTGIASYYWQPQRVASGGWFNPNALTAAHRSLPFGTKVRVTHLRNGRSVVVRINDRGPFIKGRIIDLSKRAAGVIGMQGSGIARVKVEVLGRS